MLNKIDFMGIISVHKANPNGDPLISNMPRQDYDGHGIISDVCLKRKIRDRLYELGENILIRKDDQADDGLRSIYARVRNAKTVHEHFKKKEDNEFYKATCQEWYDVRAFGQVFAKKGTGTISIRGPVSISCAESIDVIEILQMNITKSTNLDDAPGKDSATIGMRYLVENGIYVFRGAVYPELARHTGFTEEDAAILKQVLPVMFDNDVSALRPVGSVIMERLYWWDHGCPNGKYSPAQIMRSVCVKPLDEYPYYEITENPLDGLDAEILV